MTYDNALVAEVWDRARILRDRDPTVWRQDECGAWIYRDHYDSKASEYGWWIASTSSAPGGNRDGLRPFHRRNGYDIENGQARCAVTADRAGADADQRVSEPRNTDV